jgi:cyanophycinase
MKLHSFTKGTLLLGASLFSHMALAACLSTEAEPNNADTSANVGACSASAITGSLSTTSDVDWYKLDVTAGGAINISLSHGSGKDFDWYLYPASGSYVASRSTASNPETGSYTATAAGTYYIKIKSYSGSGTYTLSASFPTDTIIIPPTGAVTGKVWLNGGLILQENKGIFVDGLRQITGKNYNVPNMSITTNCDTNWNTTQCPRVAIITAAAANQADGVDKYTNDTTSGAWAYSNMFQRHGFAPKHILSHHDTYASNSGNSSATGQANIAIINQADLVYVIGGDQSRLARTFLNNDGSDSPLMAAIRNRYNSGNLIYAGDSAGTAIAPSTSYGEGISIGYLNQNTLRAITPADCPYISATAASCLTSPTADFGTKIKGFSFIPNANVDTHFDNRGGKTGRFGRMIAALKNVGPQVGYGIDQNTALYVNGDIATVYGTSGVYVAEATSSNFPAGSKFTAAGVRVSYLTAGDTFKFSDRSITSAKTKLIGSTGVAAQFSTALNSSNIFVVDANGVGSTSTIFKHMIDQTPVSSTGTAPADSAHGDPLSFTLTFKKDSATKGYKNATGAYSGPYTIVKALVDVN